LRDFLLFCRFGFEECQGFLEGWLEWIECDRSALLIGGFSVAFERGVAVR
jgi:hypothetical protein